MNDLERFLAVCAGERPDYVPTFGFPGAPGVSGGAMAKTHARLVETGMPEWIDGCHRLGRPVSTETWCRYWGTTQPLSPGFFPAEPARGFRTASRIEGEFEIIDSENGSLLRQVIDNDITYSMPEFIRYPVRDRASWQFYRDRVTPGDLWPAEQIEQACRAFDGRDKPLAVSVGGTWGALREMMGPEAACTVLYDDPALAAEIIDFLAWKNRTYVFPLIERLRPEIVGGWEDMCYNHGMLIGPDHFRRLCAPTYRQTASVARDCGVALFTVDCDGNVMELVDVLVECGVNGLYPFECHGGNDCFAVRRKHPEFVLMGWLEKECINAGNERTIADQIRSKVPPLLEAGRYFPNGDHGLQPLATFPNLCRFMTHLHEATGNPTGEFPRMH
ncbi:MAG TPA: uroporphyrinogen decarboxylase family protein [Phycisphaerae bacterium]|nr:uroporphyrinogen decarboxylase family protein [Phycisphaerae bacterium]